MRKRLFFVFFISLISPFASFAQVDSIQMQAGKEPGLIASSHQVEVKDRFDVLEERLEQLGDSLVPGLNERVNFSVVDVPVQEFLRGLAEVHKLNISVNPGISLRVTNNFTNAKVSSLLLFLCREYELDIRFVNSIMSFHKWQAPQQAETLQEKKEIDLKYDPLTDLLTVELAQDGIMEFAKQITQNTGKNVIVAPEARSTVLNGYIYAKPFREALEMIAYANKLKLRVSESDFYVLEAQELQASLQEQNTARYSRRNPRNSRQNTRTQVQLEEGLDIEMVQDSLLKVEAMNVPIKALIQKASEEAGTEFMFFTELEGVTTAFMEQVSFEDLLSFLLQTGKYTYKNQDGVYLIGDRQQEGLRHTQLLRLQYRTVKDMEKSIPAELSKGVEIKLFPELNGMIMSGSKPQIREIETLVKALDQPVPNILIEVIVAEVRKGASVQTGIKAMIADSVPATGGQVFPGIDFTLSSSSINKIFGVLGDKGIVNLGKVTPNFYATIKAMEQNNNLNIRSTPKLSAMNGHEATLIIGKSVYYLEETQNVNGGVNPITTVTKNYKKVEANLSLTINPSVSGDEHITLDIDAEFSDFVNPEIQGAPPGSTTRQFTSQIRIKNEEMVVLGGLEEVRKQRTGSGVPLLSRIPILKWLFSSRTKDKSESRLLVFIKPKVVY